MIESVLYSHLLSLEISSFLALYDGAPAIFYQLAANDTDSRWNEGQQFPRIDYNIAWSYDPALKIAGTMSIDVWCLRNSNMQPEEIGDQIVRDIHGSLMTHEGNTYCIEWSRTDAFEGTNTKAPKTIGVTLVFDVIFYSIDILPSPNPVMGLNEWLKSNFEDIKIIGVDDFPDVILPNENNPVGYVRIDGEQFRNQNMYSMATINGNCKMHIIGDAKRTYIKSIIDKLSIDGQIITSDKRSILIKTITASVDSSPTKQGQLTIGFEYRVPVAHVENPVITEIKREGNG